MGLVFKFAAQQLCQCQSRTLSITRGSQDFCIFRDYDPKARLMHTERCLLYSYPIQKNQHSPSASTPSLSGFYRSAFSWSLSLNLPLLSPTTQPSSTPSRDSSELPGLGESLVDSSWLLPPSGSQTSSGPGHTFLFRS